MKTRTPQSVQHDFAHMPPKLKKLAKQKQTRNYFCWKYILEAVNKIMAKTEFYIRWSLEYCISFESINLAIIFNLF